MIAYTVTRNGRRVRAFADGAEASRLWADLMRRTIDPVDIEQAGRRLEAWEIAALIEPETQATLGAAA